MCWIFLWRSFAVEQISTTARWYVLCFLNGSYMDGESNKIRLKISYWTIILCHFPLEIGFYFISIRGIHDIRRLVPFPGGSVSN